MPFVVYDKFAKTQHSLNVSSEDGHLEIKKQLLKNTNLFEYGSKQLYVHVPFCMFHCSFCVYRGDLVRSNSQLDSYMRYLIREFEFSKHTLPNLELDAIFVGGGTVTTLSNDQLDQLLNKIKECFNIISVDGEFTVELAPHGLSKKKLNTLVLHGVNRVSIGIQSLDEELLRKMQRPPKSQKYMATMFRDIKELSFRDVNVDLMIGIHGRTYENLVSDFLQLAEWGCRSIMVYIDMRIYRNQTQNNKDKEISEAKKMILQLENLVSSNFVLNKGNGVSEYNRFIAVDQSPTKDILTRYSTNLDDPNLFCLGIGPGAKSWNRDWVFYTDRP